MRGPARFRRPLVGTVTTASGPTWHRRTLTLESVHRPAGSALRRSCSILLLALVAANCHVADVTAPARVEPVRLSFAGDSFVVMGTRAYPLVSATVGETPLASSRIRLHSSDTTVLALSGTGDSVIARRLGRATLTAFVESSLFPAIGPSVARTVFVVPATFQIAPSPVTLLALGDTIPLAFVALDANGEAIVGAPVKWHVADSAVARIIGTRVTSLAVGTTVLTAILDGDTARAPLVISQRVAGYAFSVPRLILDAIGAETTLVATPYDARGNVIPDGPAPTWSSADTTRLSVTLEGRLRALANGVVPVLAGRPEGGADTLRVEVNQRAVSVVITPVTTTSIQSKGGTIDLLGRGFDRLGNTVTDDVPFWRSLDEQIAVVDSSGLRKVTVTGYAAGVVGIVAQQDGVADTIEVTVINDPASITTTPESATLASVQDSLPIAHTVRNAEGGTIPEAEVAWRSTDSTVVRVVAPGLVEAADSGTARVIAQVTNAAGETFADTTFVHVTDAPATVDVLVVEDTLLYLGDSLLVPVTILNARDDPLARDRVRWIPRTMDVVSVNSIGLVVATATGSSWVVADGGTPRDSMLVVVTNDVASVTIDGVADGVVDTIPTPGRTIQYTATARNAAGEPLAGYQYEWSSTAPEIVGVDGTGLATALANGAAGVIVRVAGVTDTARVLVRHPTRIHVDNERATEPQFGTLARPLASIGQGVQMARQGDTVVVADGLPYLEPVSIGRGIALFGDSAAYLAAGRDPSRLPVIAPGDGATAIAISDGPTVVRHLTIQNGVDGMAVVARGADVAMSSVQVNPGLTEPRGAGILVEKAPTAARLDSVRIQAVREYGVRVVASVDGRVTRTYVQGVATLSGAAGSGSDGVGIAIEGGRGGTIAQSTVRSAGGTALLLAGTADASLVGNSLAGERQLATLSSATGTTIVSDNSFDLARLAEDPFTGNSTTDGRAGLTIGASSGVQVERNRFHDGAASSSLMDAIRLVDARGARLTANRFTGGRRAVRAERSTWEQMRTRADSVALVIEAVQADTLTLTDDTLTTASTSCLLLRNAVSRLTRTTLAQCGVGDAAALDVTGGSVLADQLLVSGTNPRAVLVDSARMATVTRGVVRGPGAGTIGVGGRAGLELSADSVQLTGSFVTGYPDRAGAYVVGVVLRVDTNAVNRSRTGLVIGGAPVSVTLRDNDLYDADLAALDVSAAVQASDNWWGDGRGPRGTSTETVGDTVYGPAVTSPYRATPIRPGISVARLRMLRGDGQSAPAGSTLPLPFSVRVTDADGLPVRSVAVTYSLPSTSKCSFGGLRAVNAVSNDSGIAEATLTLGKPAGSCTATVTASGASDVLTFTATGY